MAELGVWMPTSGDGRSNRASSPEGVWWRCSVANAPVCMRLERGGAEEVRPVSGKPRGGSGWPEGERRWLGGEGKGGARVAADAGEEEEGEEKAGLALAC